MNEENPTREDIRLGFAQSRLGHELIALRAQGLLDTSESQRIHTETIFDGFQRIDALYAAMQFGGKKHG
jgi:hypothetical protein